MTSPDSDAGPDLRDLSRRQFMTDAGALTALLASQSVGLLGWGGDDTDAKLSQVALEYRKRFGADVSAVEQFGEPSWIISLSDADDIDSIKSELDGYENASVTRSHVGSATVTAAIPTSRLDAVAGLAYVENIDLNRTVSWVEPLYGLRDAGVWDDDQLSSFGWVARSHLRVKGQDGAPTDGVAFDEDASPSTPAAAKSTSLDAASHGIDTSNGYIGIIDTGLNVADEVFGTDASTRVADASKNMITGETVADSGLSAIEDGAGHGTFVASQMAANPTLSEYNDYGGLCPSADLAIAKALNDDGSGSIDDIAAAVRLLTDEGVDVICMSLGSPKWSEALDDALAYAVENGVVPVAAVGNDRQRSRWPNSPSSSPNTIAVTALTNAAATEQKVAYFANTGDHNGVTDLSGGKTAGQTPDIGAPGMQQEAASVTSSGSHFIEELSGTSMAAPWVAGIAQLVILDKNPSPGEDETRLDIVRDWMQTYAKRTPKIAAREVGAGEVSLANIRNESAPDQTQAEAMTSAAESRGAFYRALSDVQGGRVAEFQRETSHVLGGLQ